MLYCVALVASEPLSVSLFTIEPLVIAYVRDGLISPYVLVLVSALSVIARVPIVSSFVDVVSSPKPYPNALAKPLL